MTQTYRTYISLPPKLLAMLEAEAKETGNSFSSIIRRRLFDSYREEDRYMAVAESENSEEEPVSVQ